ncbi:MAG: NAD(P)-dependent oxidoreductase [Ferruginibacter sp.]
MILITAPVHPRFLEQLQAKQLAFEYHPGITLEALFQKIPQATGLVVSTHPPIDQPLIERGSSLKWIARLGSGMEHIDTHYAASKGIRCISSPEGNCKAVGEFTLGLVINLLRNQYKAMHQVRKGQWVREANRGEEMFGKTIGIIGYGHTGQSFVNVLRSIGMRILIYDRFKTGFSDHQITEVPLSVIEDEAEIISFHIPMLPENRHMANLGFFKRLKKNPWIINTARGEVMDTRSLLEALQAGYVRGAALDVLENEAITNLTPEEQRWFDQLCADPRVLISPHIAGYTQESFFKLGQVLLEKLGLAE